jgi:hypothetical protein
MNKGQTKQMTPKQIQANRRNARQSTGPKTPQGKARSRLNALQHGLLAREAVLQGFWIRESPRELEALHRQFWRHCAPVGALEEMLVEQIVTCYWRKRRVLRAESGEIAQSVGGGVWQRLRHRAGQRARFEETRGMLGESKLKLSTAGLDYMTETLQSVGADIVATGKLTNEMRGELIRVFGVDSDGAAVELGMLEKWRRDNPDGLKTAALKAKYEEEVLGFIAGRLELYGYLRAAVEVQERREEEERRRASVLPSGETVERMMRYESALDRQLFRLLRQLERWQRMRMAGNLPQPMAMTGEDGMGARAGGFWDDGSDECGRGLSGPTAGTQCGRAEGKRMAGVDPISRVRGRGAEAPPTFREPSRRSRGPGLGGRAVAGNPSERQERAATDLRRRPRAAKPDKAAASLRDAKSLSSMSASRSDAATIRNDAATITKPNDGGSPDAETMVSNGKMDVPGRSRPADTTQICETKPNAEGLASAKTDGNPEGSLKTT